MTQFDLRPDGLLAWQWGLYRAGHTERTNLVMHVFTVPMFQLGTLSLLASIFLGPLLALIGVVFMVSAMAVQGRGHAAEPQSPVPFRGPLDVIVRIFVEQWITFPRFVLSGGFALAWAASHRASQK